VVNPYNSFLLTVLMFFLWFSYLTVKTFTHSFHFFWLFVLVGSLCFYFWFQTFYALWWLFEMERGVISAKEFLELTSMPVEQIEYLSMVQMKAHQCNITSPSS